MRNKPDLKGGGSPYNKRIELEPPKRISYSSCQCSVAAGWGVRQTDSHRFGDRSQFQTMMNSNLIKDQTIHNLLARLRERFGQNAFAVVDYWDADLFAVGIARTDNPGVLAYISTRNKLGGKFYVELEMPPKPVDDLPYQGVGKRKGIDFEQVAQLVENHLKLSEGSGN